MSLGWWAISGEAFLDALRRAANGEDPDLLYAEQYANSDHEPVTPDGPRTAFCVPEVWTRYDDRPNRGMEHTEVSVVIDPELPHLGMAKVNAFGPPRTIALREWNEQVFLHECLHVLLDGRVPTSHGDPHGHDTISRAEIALWEAGWRLTASTTDPSEGETRG